MQIKKLYNKLKTELITYHKNRQGVNNLHFYYILLPSKCLILILLALIKLTFSFINFKKYKTLGTMKINDKVDRLIFSNIMYGGKL